MTAPETAEIAETGTSHRTISRRTVVRTGATAAWAVPAISIATAAPAMAVSNQGDLNGSGIIAIFYPGRWRLILTVRPIQNDGDIRVGAITLIARMPKKRGSLSKKPRKVSHSGRGWRFVRSYRANGRWQYVFTYPQGLAPGAKTSTLTITLKPRRRRPQPSGMAFYTAFARNSDPAGGSTSIRKPGQGPKS
jgi:hypothetical protein